MTSRSNPTSFSRTYTIEYQGQQFEVEADGNGTREQALEQIKKHFFRGDNYVGGDDVYVQVSGNRSQLRDEEWFSRRFPPAPSFKPTVQPKVDAAPIVPLRDVVGEKLVRMYLAEHTKCHAEPWSVAGNVYQALGRLAGCEASAIQESLSKALNDPSKRDELVLNDSAMHNIVSLLQAVSKRRTEDILKKPAFADYDRSLKASIYSFIVDDKVPQGPLRRKLLVHILSECLVDIPLSQGIGLCNLYSDIQKQSIAILKPDGSIDTRNMTKDRSYCLILKTDSTELEWSILAQTVASMSANDRKESDRVESASPSIPTSRAGAVVIDKDDILRAKHYMAQHASPSSWVICSDVFGALSKQLDVADVTAFREGLMNDLRLETMTDEALTVVLSLLKEVPSSVWGRVIVKPPFSDDMLFELSQWRSGKYTLTPKASFDRGPDKATLVKALKELLQAKSPIALDAEKLLRIFSPVLKKTFVLVKPDHSVEIMGQKGDPVDFDQCPFIRVDSHRIFSLMRKAHNDSLSLPAPVREENPKPVVAVSPSASDGDNCGLSKGERSLVLDMVAGRQLTQQALRERDSILAHDKAGDFYFVVQNTLNKVIAACMVLDSEMLGTAKTTKATSTLDSGVALIKRLEEWSQSIPGVGLIVKILNGPLQGLDDFQKTKAIKHVTTLFTGALQYEPLSEMIARSLAQELLHEIESLPTAKAGFFKRQMQKLSHLKDKLLENEQVDTKLRLFAEQHCEILLIALMKGVMKKRPEASDVPSLVQIILNREPTAAPAAISPLSSPERESLPVTRPDNSVDMKALMERLEQQEEAHRREREELLRRQAELEKRSADSAEATKLLKMLKKSLPADLSAGSLGGLDQLLVSPYAPGQAGAVSLERQIALHNQRLLLLEQMAGAHLGEFGDRKETTKPEDDKVREDLFS